MVGEGDSASCPGDPVDGPSCSPFVLLVTAGSWHCPFPAHHRILVEVRGEDAMESSSVHLVFEKWGEPTVKN